MIFDHQAYFLTIKSMRRNKMRSFLTSLGIIIGISSVIIIMSVGAGAKSLVVNQVSSIGSNLVGVLPGASDPNGPPAAVMGINVTTLVNADAQAIKNNIPEVVAVNGYIRGSATATWREKTVDTSFLGTTGDYQDVDTKAELTDGRFFTNEEDQQVSRLVVLGSSVAKDLFSGSSAIGQSVKINKENFKVIGVMKERGTAGFQNQDTQVFIPLETAQKIMLGIHHLSAVRARVVQGADIQKVVSDIEVVLREQHKITDPKEDDFTVRATEEALKTLDTVTNALSYFLAMVAGISLIVGGIGIMNIMLVSVSESTKEIGLRKAVGATNSDINTLFLMQTISVTLLGGVGGIIIGIVISFLVAVVAQALGYQWDFVISLSSVLLSLSFTIIVGLVFGWYPARQAAHLNPIEALRYE
ncbi:MAG: multidrug ABC transporter substrate-binding protein [Parcubacteria group bacterium]|nr:MAG: multidrug ABC transporter substrate-binding protein [Parcubacteria group bacterium]